MTTLTAETSTEGSTTSTATPPVAAAQTKSDAAPTTGTLLAKQSDSKADQAQPGDGKPVAKAPIVYDFKMPKDGPVADPEVLKAYGEVANELNLPPESAQKVIDKLAPVMSTRSQQAIEAVRSEWRAATTNDKEIGGEKLNDTLKAADRVLFQFGSSQLRELLQKTGEAADPTGRLHTEWLRLLARVDRAMSPDPLVNEGSRTNGDPARPRDDVANFNDPDVQKRVFYPKT